MSVRSLVAHDTTGKVDPIESRAARVSWPANNPPTRDAAVPANRRRAYRRECVRPRGRHRVPESRPIVQQPESSAPAIRCFQGLRSISASEIPDATDRMKTVKYLVELFRQLLP